MYGPTFLMASSCIVCVVLRVDRWLSTSACSRGTCNRREHSLFLSLSLSLSPSLPFSLMCVAVTRGGRGRGLLVLTCLSSSPTAVMVAMAHEWRALQRWEGVPGAARGGREERGSAWSKASTALRSAQWVWRGRRGALTEMGAGSSGLCGLEVRLAITDLRVFVVFGLEGYKLWRGSGCVC